MDAALYAKLRLSGAAALATSVCALCAPTLALAQTGSMCTTTFTRTLSMGATGPEVLQLQTILNMSPDTAVAETGDGSPGHETTRFGALTKAAVIRFQEKYASEILAPNDLTSGNGRVGSATRAKLNALCAAGTVGMTSPTTTATTSAGSTPQVRTGGVLGAATTTVSAPALVVSAADQPAPTLAPAGALYVPFTTFALTARDGDVTVNSVTVARTGPAQDQVFADWDLYDTEGNFYGVAFFTSNHTATVKDPFTIPAGKTITFSVVGDMAGELTDYEGQMAGLSVVGIEASAPVEGILPVHGTQQTINGTLAIGVPHMSVGSDDPRSARTRHINDTDIVFAAVRITPDSVEDQILSSIVWRQTGSASPQDIANVYITVNGERFPAQVDGNEYSAEFGNGIRIAKGMSAEIQIRGDLTVWGAGRTAQFEINDGGDIGLQGANFGYFLFPIPESNTDTLGSGNRSIFATDDGTTDGSSVKPFYLGSTVTISGASVTSIGK